MKQIIIIQGYPKSGNSWLSRLLGDVYNSPVQGLPGQEDGSLATEGQNRPGNHCIIQAHWQPEDYHDKFTTQEIANRRTIFIIRNPLDVAVSASYFWNISLEETVRHMIDGNWPFVKFPSWSDYYSRPEWDNMTSYEALSQKIISELQRLTGERHVSQAAYRQSFEVKRRTIKERPQDYSYDERTQLHNLRRGTVGDWTSHFSKELLSFALDNFGETMERFGYYEE